jgi:Rhodopirellula transposase DDE domain
VLFDSAKPVLIAPRTASSTIGHRCRGMIRGDPEAALLWVSKSQRRLSAALAERGFTARQKLVGRLLRRPAFSL